MKILMTSLLMILAQIAYSQKPIDASTLDQMSNPASVFTEIPLPEPRYTGSYYLHDDMHSASISIISGQTIHNQNYKYDVLNQFIELETEPQKKRIIDIRFITKIQDTESSIELVNPRVFGINHLEGMATILMQGESAMLGALHKIKIKKANYNVALDIGTRDHEFVPEQKLVFILKDQGKHFFIKRTPGSIAKSLDLEKNHVKKTMKALNIDLDINEQLFNFLVELTQ